MTMDLHAVKFKDFLKTSRSLFASTIFTLSKKFRLDNDYSFSDMGGSKEPMRILSF
jgi:hypothetical protein